MRNDWVSEVPSSHEDLHHSPSEPSSSLAYIIYIQRYIIGIRGISWVSEVLEAYILTKYQRYIS